MVIEKDAGRNEKKNIISVMNMHKLMKNRIITKQDIKYINQKKVKNAENLKLYVHIAKKWYLGCIFLLNITIKLFFSKNAFI